MIDAKWNGNTGTLDESFEYADGKREKRVWTIVKDGDRYTGTAGDVVGTATGAAAGNVLQWRYVLALPVDGRVWNMDMDDWMFLMDERTMLNRTTMSKFGVRVGEVMPWLLLNRDGCIVFLHPETGDAMADHTTHAVWFGPAQPLRLEVLSR
mgnify:CR=1 FL=1